MILTKKLLSTGLQRRAALAMVALLALLWSAVAWNHQDVEHRELDDIRRETATLARLFANDADSTFRSADHALLQVRSAWASHPADMGDVVKEYVEFLDGAVLQIAIIGADGNLAYTNLGMPKEPTFLGEREHFKVHLGGLHDKLFVSRPLKGKVSGKWSIQLSRPIFRKAQWVGVVVISVDPNYFVKFYQNAGMGKDGAAGMLRDTGEVVAHSSGQDVYVGKVIDPSRFTRPGAPQQGSYRHKSQVDGVERVSSYYRLPQYGLTVAVGPSLDERLAPLRSQQRQTLLAAGLVTVLVLLVAGLLLRAMVRKEAAMTELTALHATVRQSEQRYRSFVEGASDIVFELNPEGVFTYVSPNWTAYLGHAVSEVQGHSFMPFVHPGDVAACAAFLQSVIGSDQKQPGVEYRVLHKDSTWRWYAASGSRLCDADGKVVSFQGIGRDVTERKKADLRQQRHIRVLKMLTDKAPLASILKTIAVDVEAARPTLLCSILLLDAQGKHLLHGAAPSLPDFYTQAINGLAVGPGVGSCGTAAFTGERVIVQDIETHPNWAPFLELTRRAGLGSCWSQPILSGQGKVLGTFALYHREPCEPTPAELLWIEDEAVLTALAIEKDDEDRQLHDSEARYRFMAHHDALTGLANRALFTDRLQRDLASARRDKTSLALMFIDLDKFKPVNDQHGHAVGDLLLQAVAQRMQVCVRDSDTMARIGGDEFVVLLRDVAGEPEALAVAEKIRANLERPFELAGHRLDIACCVGVALYPQHGLDDLTLSKNADHAMYQAKERGRNQVVLYQMT